MIKGFGSWVTVADPASRADVMLTLHDGPGRPRHLPRHPGGRHLPGARTVAPRCALGTGAQVAGQGPPPAPPL